MNGTNTHGSVAEGLLRALKRRGIDCVLANAGTDFAPIIEGLVKLGAHPEAIPRFITVPHENLAMAMAHGDRKSTRLNSSHMHESRMPSSA